MPAVFDTLTNHHPVELLLEVYSTSRTIATTFCSKYYRNADARIHETLANYGSLSVTRPDLIELLRADKPELVAELEATVKEMLEKVGE